MDYYIFQNSEDGLRVNGPMDRVEAEEHIADLTSEDIVPEHRALFQDDIPDAYTDTRYICVIKGEVVRPVPQYRMPS